MEQTTNISPEAPTDEPASPVSPRPRLPAAQVSSRLAEALLEEALEAGRDIRPGREQRADGWTPDRIRAFLVALAACGVVRDAARAVGKTPASAYRLCNSAKGRPFRLAWKAALQLAEGRIADQLMSRAIHGCVEIVVRDGKIFEERHRYDNRLTMAVLTRLEEKTMLRDEDNATVRTIAEEFEQFLDIAADQDCDAAAAFIADRREADSLFFGSREARLLERLASYALHGAGLPDEIDVSDLDPADRKNWTDEQADRAERSGLLDRPG